ncbi:hypothetical protein EC957_008030 [Mortierella hygrophila]|uniref:Uncharacterized protein n=1 Tax=Mortierella hygrophila TaxID=979708 RepID=A0A9P6FDF7_9FUNG|nr:hypothetical protein EC957_008030 [Mortierella hygrophila]
MSPRGGKFINLSEDELVRSFWTNVTLRKELQGYAHPTLPSFTGLNRTPQEDVVSRLKNFDPGELINRLLTDIGGFTEDERRTDHYFMEIRNVVKTAEDVNQIWDCDPNDIKILGIDLGQAFVVGASALLPSFALATSTDEEKQGAITEIDMPLSVQFHNLAVSQKAVYQPTFKHRRWLEKRKGRAVEGTEPIAHKETNLPPLCGPETSITEYVKRFRVVESDLDTFYNNVTLKKHLAPQKIYD